jgi:RimJ/RimL family protein N-acetyltransferase
MDICAEVVRVSDRVTLRPLRAQDAGAIAQNLSDWNVTRWLTPVPFPYALADAEWFLSNDVSRGALVIEADHRFAGVVQISESGELGYWLHLALHGKGIMTHATEALVAQHFAKGGGRLTSGYHIGNVASCSVLETLGFRVTGHRVVRTARGEDVVLRRMVLTPQDWQNRIWITTPRLVIRPLMPRHAPALTAFGGLPDVARMLGSVPSPWPQDHARDWIAKGAWRGKPGFRAGVFMGSTLIGMVGLGGQPMGAACFIDPAFAGRGIATEAMQALLAHAYARFDLDEITADHFTDNPASGRVLQKLGFQNIGEGMGTSAARLEPAPVVHYRLTKARFESLIP